MSLVLAAVPALFWFTLVAYVPGMAGKPREPLPPEMVGRVQLIAAGLGCMTVAAALL